MSIFLFVFAISKFSRRATRFHEKGHFAKVFEKWGASAPCVPLVPISMGWRLASLHLLLCDNDHAQHTQKTFYLIKLVFTICFVLNVFVV